jgi:hypothetical protein
MGAVASYRFQVALSFQGSHRDRVRQIARILGAQLSEERVPYDEWYREEFARANLDLYLADIYAKQSRLLVFFLSREYAAGEWTGLEWRAGRELIKQKQDDRVMLLRFDDAAIPGLYSTDGYLDNARLTDEQVAAEIVKRLDRVAPSPRPSIESAVEALRRQTELGFASSAAECGFSQWRGPSIGAASIQPF